jgi:hypothetical protein
MPLVVKALDNRSCPVVVCDHCGEQITDALDGNYQWRMGLNDTDFGGRVYFTHKGCCKAFEDAHPEDGFVWGAMELSCLPIYLGNGLALDWEGARRSAETLGSIE